MVIGAGDQQIRINRTGGGPGGAQVSMSTAETGAVKMSVSPTGQMHMEMERMTMASLAQQLTPMLDRPVVDHTDLKGAFTIALDLSIQDMMQVARNAGVATLATVPARGTGAGRVLPVCGLRSIRRVDFHERSATRAEARKTKGADGDDHRR